MAFDPREWMASWMPLLAALSHLGVSLFGVVFGALTNNEWLVGAGFGGLTLIAGTYGLAKGKK